MKDRSFIGPYSLKYFRNLGTFDYDICIKCSFTPTINGQQLYNITKTQNYRVKVGDCSLDCSNTLTSNPDSQFANTLFDYDSSSTLPVDVEAEILTIYDPTA